MNKKKILTLATVLLLLAILATTSLAYFQDDDKVTNTFTVGSVEIALKEDFTPDSQLIPVISNETPEDDPNYVPKSVTVANIGKNPAYIQVLVAIPAALDGDNSLDGGLLHIRYTEAKGWEAVDTDSDTANGIQPLPGPVTVSGVPYHVYKFRNNDVISENATTAPAIDGVYIDAAADIEVTRDKEGNILSAYFVWEGKEITDFNVAGMKLDIYVASQAIQSEGFANAQTALAAFTEIPAFTP